MLHILVDQCPATLWLQQQFRVKVNLINGHTIAIDFKLASTGCMTGREILKRFGDNVLSSPDMAMLSDPLATILNRKMEVIQKNVFSHGDLSMAILGALETGDLITAGQDLKQLAEALIDYSPMSNQVWDKWTLLVVHFIASQDMPESGGMDLFV